MNERLSVADAETAGQAPRTGRRAAAIVAIAAIALGAMAGAYRMVTGRHAATEPTRIDGRDVPRLEGGAIRYSRAFAARSNIALAPCAKSHLSPLVSVTGTVVFDPERIAAVGARIAGRIRQVFKYPGDHVRKGEVVAELESAQLGEAQAALPAARAHLEAATANAKRESQLADARVTSQREAEAAIAGAAVAKAELFAVEQRVKAYGGTSAGEIGVLSLASPIDGKLIDLHVSRGQSVEPSFTVFRVADLQRVWIELAVFEREIGRIHVGDEVELSPQTNTSIVLRGTTAHVGDTIDLDTRSGDVRVVVNNEDESLRPGQSVLAKIHLSPLSEAALIVPLEAVTHVDGKPIVFIGRDDQAVEPRSVVVGSRDNTHVEVLSGLTEGERIVVSGVFALKSEIFR
jgi:cobalt-zinc-cadmium efflux system membrane fusion protein